MAGSFFVWHNVRQRHNINTKLQTEHYLVVFTLAYCRGICNEVSSIQSTGSSNSATNTATTVEMVLQCVECRNIRPNYHRRNIDCRTTTTTTTETMLERDATTGSLVKIPSTSGQHKYELLSFFISS